MTFSIKMNFYPINYDQYNGSVYVYGFREKERKLSCLRIAKVPFTLFVSANSITDEHIIMDITAALHKYGAPVLSWEVKMMYSIIGVKIDFSGKRLRDRYLMLHFETEEFARNAERLITRGLVVNYEDSRTFKAKVHLSWVPLWYQYFLYRHIDVAKWLFVPKYEDVTFNPRQKLSKCRNEYLVLDIESIKIGPDLPPPNVDFLLFDIEVYCSVPDKFPDATVAADEIFMISLVYGKDVFILAKGDGKSINLEALKSRWPGRNVAVVEYLTETTLIYGFVQHLLEIQPPIICGYNTMGFDWNYIIKRAEGHAKCWTQLEQLSYNNKPAAQKDVNWSSSAFASQRFVYLKSSGISNMDLLPIIRYQYKLETYTLDSVSQYFLKRTKDDMPHELMRKAFEQRSTNTALYTSVAEYCIQDSILVEDLMKKLSTVENQIGMEVVTSTSLEDLVVKGTMWKINCTILKVAYKDGILFERKETPEKENYRGAVVFEPILGLHKNLVSFDFQSLYPSIMRTYNLCVSTLVSESQVHIKDDDCHVMEWEDHIGCEHDTTLKAKKAELENFDAQSEKIRRWTTKGLRMEDWVEYMKAYISREGVKKYKPDKILCGRKRFRWYKGYEGVIPKMLASFLDERKNVRANIKKDAKKLRALKIRLEDAKSPEEKEALSEEVMNMEIRIKSSNALQLALKLAANGTYGYTGTPLSMVSTVEIAACTTYYGRRINMEASQIISGKFGGLRIYGDTDSNYVKFLDEHMEKFISENLEAFNVHVKEKTAMRIAEKEGWAPNIDYEKRWFFAKKVSEYVSQQFSKHLVLEFEDKIYSSWFIASKKKYGSFSLKEDGTIDENLDAHGMVLCRRDNCKFTKDVYGTTLKMAFKGATLNELVDYVWDSFLNLIIRNVPLSKLYFTKGVKSWNDGDVSVNEEGAVHMGDYKVRLKASKKHLEGAAAKNALMESLPAHAVLAMRMNRMGECVVPGQRIKYIISHSGLEETHTKYISCSFAEKHASEITIDYVDYIKLTAKAVDGILSIIYPYYVHPSRVELYAKNAARFEANKKLTRFFCNLITDYDKYRVVGPLEPLVRQIIKKKECMVELAEMFAPLKVVEGDEKIGKKIHF